MTYNSLGQSTTVLQESAKTARTTWQRAGEVGYIFRKIVFEYQGCHLSQTGFILSNEC